MKALKDAQVHRGNPGAPPLGSTVIPHDRTQESSRNRSHPKVRGKECDGHTHNWEYLFAWICHPPKLTITIFPCLLRGDGV